MATNSNVVDVEDELFWKEIKHAARQVELNHGVSFDITRGTNNASIFWCVDEHDGNVFDTYVTIELRETEPKQPALLVP